jgi:hypothetical protein
MVEGAYTNSEGVIVDEKYVAYVAIPGNSEKLLFRTDASEKQHVLGTSGCPVRILVEKSAKRSSGMLP